MARSRRPGGPNEEGAADPSANGAAIGEQARAAAARQLKAQPGEFTVVTIEPTQWSDSSLGCGKPGARSAQVMTKGYTVVLERQGQRHQVNVAGSHAVICDSATHITGTDALPTSARGLDRVAMLARQDLAHRLRLDPAQIGVANVEPRRWTDDDMNCSSGGGAPATGEVARQAAIGSISCFGADVLVSHGSALGAGLPGDRSAMTWPHAAAALSSRHLTRCCDLLRW